MAERYDILLLQGSDYSGSGVADIRLSLGSGLLFLGPQKATQRFLIFLLTRLGSIPSDPEFGTSLLFELTQTGSNESVTAAFNSAAGYAINALDDVTLPDDERLVSATLEDYLVNRDSINLTVRIGTAAGSSRIITVPVSNLS
jgi:hypothetical protein